MASKKIKNIWDTNGSGLVAEEKDLYLTKEVLKSVATKNAKNHITDELVETINGIIREPEYREEFRDNVLGYLDVLGDKRVNMVEYINAVKFVGFKVRGSTDRDAYIKTFPDRFKRLSDEGKGSDISAWTNGYKRSKMVIQMLERSIVPTYIVNADVYQDSINVLVKLMHNSKSDLVRQASAKTLMDGLTPPEVTKFSVDVNIKEDDAMIAMRATTQALLEAQKGEIVSGRKSAFDIANTDLVVEEGEYDEIEED